MTRPSPATLDAVVEGLMRPPRKRRRAVGTLYRACDDALAGTWPDAVIQRWWLGQSSQVHDESDAAAVAWEALASRELIPMSWIELPTRSFVRMPGNRWCFVCQRPGCEHTLARALRASPWTLRDCVVFASDPEGVGAAEALAEEISFAYAHTARVAWVTHDADDVVRLRAKLEARCRSEAMMAPELSLLATGYAFHAVEDGAVVLSAALV